MGEKTPVTIVAGTFSYLHIGHKKLLDKAVSTGNRVIIGLTSQDYAIKTKSYTPPDYAIRKSNLESYLRKKTTNFSIVELNNNQGDATNNSSYEKIVVSRETAFSAINLNRKRMKSQLKPMEIIIVDSVVAKDYMLVSSSRIARGSIDSDGNRLTPLRISLSRGNSLDSSKLRIALNKLFKNITLEIAERAPVGIFQNKFDVRRLALESIEDKDYSFCVREKMHPESEFRDAKIYIECEIIDMNGHFTVGNSSSFSISDTQYEKLQMTDKLSPELNWCKPNLSGKLIYEAMTSAMFPRTKPWEFDMLGYHSTI